MKKIKVDKITLNIGAGKDQNKLEKGVLLLKKMTGITPVKTTTQKRIPGWGLRPGLPIGCKITLRKKAAVELLKKLLQAKDNKLDRSQFDKSGNIAFGIHEYIDIPDIKYDPKIGMMGFQICVTLERNGFRVKKRSIRPAKIAKGHTITKEEAIEFMKQEFNVEIGE